MSISTTPVTESIVFSARAEATGDVLRIVRQLGLQAGSGSPDLVKVTMELEFFAGGGATGEAMAELHFSRPASIEWLDDQVRVVEDAHVFLQTLLPVPMAQNTGKRNYDKR